MPSIAEPTLDPGAVDQVVHPVETAEQCRLAATGRTDQGSDLVLGDREGDVLDRLEPSVKNGHPVKAKNLLARSHGHGDICGGRQAQFHGSLFGHDGIRRSNRSRAMMAAALTNRSTPSSTTIPAAVRETNSS